MPEVMKTRLIVKPVRAFHIGFIADAFGRQLCGQMTGRPSYVARKGMLVEVPDPFHFLSK